MAFYQFIRTQELPVSVEELWDFISSPDNLKEITPDEMGFTVTSKKMTEKMYPGMIISYKVSPLFGIKMTWVTEITQVENGKYFVDEQRVGPYKIWHHQHILEPTENGVKMTDIVSYVPPFGIIGKIANKIWIARKLEEIFSYREKVLNKRFP